MLLRNNEPTNTRRRDVNNVRRYLAIELGLATRFSEAIEVYQNDLVSTARELYADSPLDSRARKDLARSLLELSLIMIRDSQFEAAMEGLTEANIGWASLVSDASAAGEPSQGSTYQLILAKLGLTVCHLNLGNLQRAKRANDQSLELLDQAMATWPDAVRFEAVRPEAKRMRAEILKELGGFGK
jgi:tetratricopeptide (TPR) repeat protein